MLKKLERKDEFRSLEYLVKDCIYTYIQSTKILLVHPKEK